MRIIALSRNQDLPQRANGPAAGDPAGPRRVLFTAVLAVSFASASIADTHLDELVHTMYLAEVTNYCSLVDEAVIDGFRRETGRIIAGDDISEKEIESARSEAWQMGHAEWQNRGLGGFRNWCRTEGMEAADFFRSKARP
ncbi:MAG: hypothetical protein M5U09_16245 [Gammaproteobacteria bacterium]|nr:hypothetical protein [Gammaproteobacteria bacterium]